MCCLDSIPLAKSLGEERFFMTPKLNKFLGKCLLASFKVNLLGPAGGECTTRVHSPPTAGIFFLEKKLQKCCKWDTHRRSQMQSGNFRGFDFRCIFCFSGKARAMCQLQHTFNFQGRFFLGGAAQTVLSADCLNRSVCVDILSECSFKRTLLRG